VYMVEKSDGRAWMKGRYRIVATEISAPDTTVLNDDQAAIEQECSVDTS